jgi:hypothetical protein
MNPVQNPGEIAEIAVIARHRRHREPETQHLTADFTDNSDLKGIAVIARHRRHRKLENPASGEI